MTTTHAVLWKNLTSHYDPYVDGDGLCNVWESDVNVDAFESVAAEDVYQAHNATNRVTRDLCPSASVGDVVQIGEHYFAVERVGLRIVACPDGGPAHLPRTKIGGAYHARTRAEYDAAWASAQTLAEEIGLRPEVLA